MKYINLHFTYLLTQKLIKYQYEYAADVKYSKQHNENVVHMMVMSLECYFNEQHIIQFS